MESAVRAAWAAARPGSDHVVDAACVAPWVALEFDPQGWVYACCANQTYPLGRIGDERLADLWAGPRALVLREALERWDMSVGCASCRWHLAHGRSDPDVAVYDRYPVDVADPAGPAAMTFALSNRCNLGCVMCNPELSSTLRHRAGLAPVRSRYDDRFFEDLAAFVPGLRYAKFLGGEPLLVPEHDRVWQIMADAGAPPRLQITTNGTVWSDRVEWLLSTFRVDVTVSIDAVDPDVYARIRVGAELDGVMRNLHRFRERCRAAGTELRLCFCLMASNWQELAPYLRWADELDVPVSVNVVSDEGHALHDLPRDGLEAVLAHWDGATAPDGRNAGVWAMQVAQLASVIDERRRGVPPASRHGSPMSAAFLAPPPRWPGGSARPGGSAGVDAGVDAADERRRLSAWSSTGEVAELAIRPDGVVREVRSGHRRLGIDAALVGAPVGDLVDAVRRADGREVWMLDTEEVGRLLVRSAVLAAGPPRRGQPGTVVRTVAWADDDGSTMLVAEDRMHERSDATPVTLTPASAAVRHTAAP